MSSDDEFDAIPDEFEGLDFDGIPDLATARATISSRIESPTILPRPDSANSSSHYSCDDIDESVLVELDAIENRLAQNRNESTATSSSADDLSLAQILSTASSRPLGSNAAPDVISESSRSVHLSHFFGITLLSIFHNHISHFSRTTFSKRSPSD